MDILYVIIGIIFLYVGGEWTLTGALSAAERFHIPKIFSAVILVGFGTSSPELFVSLDAALSGHSDISVGNILGSNIVNILLITGLGIFIAPIYYRMRIHLESIFFVISAFLPVIFLYTAGKIEHIYGYSMLFILLLYLLLVLRRKTTVITDTKVSDIGILSIFKYIFLGIFFLLLGSKVLILGAVNIALYMGVSKAVIGLSIVAIGTSLPELATTLVAARRKESEMIIGNVVGSNIFNILLILGLTSIVGDITLPSQIFGTDSILVLVFSVVFVLLAYVKYLGKFIGFLFLLTYVGYVATLAIR